MVDVDPDDACGMSPRVFDVREARDRLGWVPAERRRFCAGLCSLATAELCSEKSKGGNTPGRGLKVDRSVCGRGSMGHCNVFQGAPDNPDQSGFVSNDALSLPNSCSAPTAETTVGGDEAMKLAVSSAGETSWDGNG
jgi:hypothetical protein